MYGRKDHYALGTSLISVSAALHWVGTGFSCLMFLDELHVLTKVIRLPYSTGIKVGILCLHLSYTMILLYLYLVYLLYLHSCFLLKPIFYKLAMRMLGATLAANTLST